MTDQIVVLGWDALDLELMERHGVAESFGSHRSKIETYVNEVIDEPHTKELWPTMITGQTPPEHGIRAKTDSDGVEWNHPALRVASALANGVVPQPVLSAIGRRLEAHGAAFEYYTAADYGDRGLETVFGPADRPISIPNYTTQYDDAHGFDAHRRRLWSEMQLDRSRDDGIKPTVDIDTVQDILGRAVGKRLTHTVSAMQSGAPLVWTWFGYLDSVGHIAPTLEYPLEAEAYRLAAGVTEMIQSLSGPETTVVSISDHGLQGGDHTHYATIASDEGAVVEDVEAVWELADWIRSVNAGGRPTPHSTPDRSVSELNEQLEAMGYI
jgi:hypothetical protein